MTLYEQFQELGIECHNHYSDLYVPDTEQTRKLATERGYRFSTFTNQVEGGRWLDIPFAFDPYWTNRQGNTLSSVNYGEKALTPPSNPLTAPARG